MPASNSPLRYPGGKGRLANYIKLTLLRNNLSPVHYVEPYAGGSALGITLLLHGFARSITINDIDPLIHAFWLSAVYDSNALCKKIASTRVSMAEWHRQQEIIETRKNRSTLAVGFAAFFLNRTNRSGIIRGGVIGGQEQAGKWKINARYTKNTLIARIQRIAELRDKIFVKNVDASDLLSRPQSGKTKAPIFWYLDPPYFVKGQHLYENHYSPKDHAQLAEIIAELDDPWIVSYDDVPEIRRLFSKFRKVSYGINYSAANHYGGKEIAFVSPGLKLPGISNPLAIAESAVKRQTKEYVSKYPALQLSLS